MSDRRGWSTRRRLGRWGRVAVTRALAAAAGWRGRPAFDARHQGANPFESALTPAPVATLPAWTARVGDGPVRAAPVMSSVVAYRPTPAA